MKQFVDGGLWFGDTNLHLADTVQRWCAAMPIAGGHEETVVRKGAWRMLACLAEGVHWILPTQKLRRGLVSPPPPPPPHADGDQSGTTTSGASARKFLVQRGRVVNFFPGLEAFFEFPVSFLAHVGGCNPLLPFTANSEDRGKGGAAPTAGVGSGTELPPGSALLLYTSALLTRNTQGGGGLGGSHEEPLLQT